MKTASIQSVDASRAIQPGESLEVTRACVAASLRAALDLVGKPGELAEGDLHAVKALLQNCQRKLFVQGVNLHHTTLFQKSREARA